MDDRGLRRFFVGEIKTIDGGCLVTGSEARHITKVLRMGRGDRLILLDGKGARFLAVIESASPREVKVVLEKRLPGPLPSPLKITLCQALLKSRHMDYLIQKTSELGVDRILPFSSERTVVRLPKNGVANKLRRWREVAQNSAKQSGRSIPAEIEECIPFDARVAPWKGEDALKVVLWEAEGVQDLKSLLKTSAGIKSFAGMVGPEGGFTREEIHMAREAGFTPVSLGNRILRSENRRDNHGGNCSI